jgi:midasin
MRHTNHCPNHHTTSTVTNTITVANTITVTIVQERCAIAPSYCTKLVAIMKELQRRRQGTKVFAGKHGFITLRDLFRWAERKPDGYQELAQHGYMLLAERLRKEDEKLVIKEVLEKQLKVNLDLDAMYECSHTDDFQQLQRVLASMSDEQRAPYNVVWTKSMKRLFTLVRHCLQHKEPVLLVGETGCGKTTGMDLKRQ